MKHRKKRNIFKREKLSDAIEEKVRIKVNRNNASRIQIERKEIFKRSSLLRSNSVTCCCE